MPLFYVKEAIMNISNFEYNGEKLSDYGMIVCSFNGAEGIETVSSGADITFNQIKPSGSNNFRLYSSIYETAFSSTFQICKNPCIQCNNDHENSENLYLSVAEISAIQRWLCQKNKYKKFKIYQKDYEHIYWSATFSSKQIELDGKTVGLELTLYTDAPFAYMDDIVIEKDCSNDLSLTVYDISDEEGFIYPDITITILENGDFSLENSLDRKVTKINGCKSGEIITLNGKCQIISSSLSSHTTLAKDFNYFFPKIINSYSENNNTYTCNLKCLITMSYSPIRKVGL